MIAIVIAIRTMTVTHTNLIAYVHQALQALQVCGVNLVALVKQVLLAALAEQAGQAQRVLQAILA